MHKKINNSFTTTLFFALFLSFFGANKVMSSEQPLVNTFEYLVDKKYNKNVQPDLNDIARVKQLFGTVDFKKNIGLQAGARWFVNRPGNLKALLANDGELIKVIAQSQAYFGKGRWNNYDPDRASSSNDAPVLVKDYVPPLVKSRAFDVTIYSFFHTILEQADKAEGQYKAQYDELRAFINKQ